MLFTEHTHQVINHEKYGKETETISGATCYETKLWCGMVVT